MKYNVWDNYSTNNIRYIKQPKYNLWVLLWLILLWIGVIILIIYFLVKFNTIRNIRSIEHSLACNGYIIVGECKKGDIINNNSNQIVNKLN